MLYFADGSPQTEIAESRADALIGAMLAQIEQAGPLRRVLLLPPDITRLHSWAGPLTVLLYRRLCRTAHVEIMPTLGTHAPMTPAEMDAMFPGIPHSAFRVHDWRNALVSLGEAPGEFVRRVSGNALDYSIRCEVDRLLVEGRWDRIISVGQLVPHEVIGIANYNKNVFVGVGGKDVIDKTHFLGAVHGMERIMGRARTPVRDVFNYMSEHFGAALPPITYVLTVRARNAQGRLATRGVFAGDDIECYERGAALCQRVNLDLLDAPLRKVVVFLDPAEFRTTWLGNKAIYRTRMAMADGGDLIILAPGVHRFGEDAGIDALIRKYGYRGTPHTLRMVKENADLAGNLSAAAHLIHGSSEGRFRITYCPGGLTREEVEGVGFEYADLAAMTARYNPARLRDGANALPDGEEVFYISNPALGLWGLKSQFSTSA